MGGISAQCGLVRSRWDQWKVRQNDHQGKLDSGAATYRRTISRRTAVTSGAAPGHSPAAAECLEDLIDHERRPEQALDHRQQVLPERVGLLPEVHQGPKNPQAVDRAAAGGRARVAAVAHHPPSLSTPPGATPPARVPTTAAACATPATTETAPGSR